MPASTEAARAEALALGGVVVVIFGGLGAWRVSHALEPRATPAECVQLRDKYLERMAVQLEPESDATRKAELAEGLAKRWSSTTECSSSVTRGEVTCALGASSTDDMERCFR